MEPHSHGVTSDQLCEFRERSDVFFVKIDVLHGHFKLYFDYFFGIYLLG
jgi:hypothetical protein